MEGLVRVLEGQEHVLEDRQGSSPHDGVEQLREDLKQSSCQGPQARATRPSVTTEDPERGPHAQKGANSRLTMGARWSWME